jgi:DNA-binding NtrC family response regulator
MPDLDGLETLRRLKSLDAHPSVLMMTAYGTVASAVQAMKVGADDFLIKPLSLEALGYQIERIKDHRRLKEECRCLRDRVACTEDGRLCRGTSAGEVSRWFQRSPLAPARFSSRARAERARS